MKKTDLKRQEKRKLIIESTKKLIDEIGFENITVREICKEAGISIGAFYHYFNDKDDIIVEIYKGIDHYLEQKVRNCIDDDDSIENILLFSKSYAQHVDDVGLEMSKRVNEFSARGKNKMFSTNKRPINTMIYEIVRRGQEKKQLRTDLTVEEIGDMILVVLRGYCFDWARKNGKFDIVSQTVLHMKIFLEALKYKEV